MGSSPAASTKKIRLSVKVALFLFCGTLTPRGSPTARKHSRLTREFFASDTPCFARARRHKQLSTVSASLTRRFDQKDKDFPCGSPYFFVQVDVPT